jgi:hypothetical protein
MYQINEELQPKLESKKEVAPAEVGSGLPQSQTVDQNIANQLSKNLNGNLFKKIK